MREKLIELLCPNMQHDSCEMYCNYPPCNTVIEAANDLIANGVTVREKGEWKHAYVERGYFTAGGNRPWVCSECNGEVIRQTDYCPNCGADMRGEEHEID